MFRDRISEMAGDWDNPSLNEKKSTENNNGVSTSTRPSLESDLVLNWTKFQSSAITPDTIAFNRKLQEIEAKGWKWYKVSRRRPVRGFILTSAI